jgi:signal transduction histidine kinase
VQATHPQRPEALGHDWSDRSYYRQLLRSAGPVFSDIVADGRGGAEVIAVSMPIIDPNGDFRGVVVGMFDLSNQTVSAFYGTIAKLRIGDVGRAYVVDSNGRVIYHTDGVPVGDDLSSVPAVQEVLRRKVGDLRTADKIGQPNAASFAPVAGTPWGLVTEEEWNTLMASSQGYQQFLLLLLVLGVVVPSAVVTFGVRRISSSLQDFISAAEEVAGGNFNRTISSPFGGELEELAEQFNSMSAQLRDSYATLERRVADRTRELATLNAISAAVSASLDLDEVLHDALDKTLEATGMEVGAAYRLDERSGELVLMAHRGLTDDFVDQSTRLPFGQMAPATADPVRPTICHVGGDCNIALGDLFANEGMQLAVSIPLVAKGRVQGVINLGTRQPREHSPEALSLLAAIGQQVGVAVENARLYEKAEESAAAAERSRLARDLHDAVSQTLFSASLISEVVPRLWERNPQEGQRRLDELRVLTRGALAEMRTLLLELRPTALQEAPLPDLLRQLAEATTGRSRIPVSLSIDGECNVPPEVKIALYRIAQEALNNVVKHSGATKVSVSLECIAEQVELDVTDDGRGFDPASAPPDHLGLGIMRERADAVGASYTLESEPGNGTSVSVVWRYATEATGRRR